MSHRDICPKCGSMYSLHNLNCGKHENKLSQSDNRDEIIEILKSAAEEIKIGGMGSYSGIACASVANQALAECAKLEGEK